mmetsp:Transcript_86369/g.241558  ORF Transcript_86369/g.241558 Transcript_86369/m.241558 type:complete len:383 (+) Transcript_86369:153-1301(+)|eukprot:CAMPEP_0117621332 /NCGR_PEP_ID=MMETSP0784-20121206/87581_1 /TAXON_ID=39447 /ORGANISM="" /LENGTH=382 /DNA_ID=CAMNT_0005425257 /DNA_START=87 /DNA_END=1235 /DNA_ORIENTATION=+
MAVHGGGGASAAAEDGVAAEEDPELTEWRRRLIEKRERVQKLQAQLSQAEAEKKGAQRAGLAGIEAARAQMRRLREELAAVKRANEAAQEKLGAPQAQQDFEDAPAKQAEAPPEVPEVPPAQQEQQEERVAAVEGEDAVPAVQKDVEAAPAPIVETEEQRRRHEWLKAEARLLRIELMRLKHEVETLEEKRPQEEEAIVRLKGDLTHTSDILESTRNATRHHELDRQMQLDDARALGIQSASGVLTRTAAEASVEKGIREKVEHRTTHMAGKAKQLTGIVAAQNLLIQRLEKAVQKEEGCLEHVESKLSYELLRNKQLKGRLRRQKDDAVAAALGVPGARRKVLAALEASPKGKSLGGDGGGGINSRSSSSPQLPRLDDGGA